MQQFPMTTPPPSGGHQSSPDYPEIPTDGPSIQRPDQEQFGKRAPSAAILTGEAGTNLVLSRLQTWGIAAQQAMAGVAYDIVADVPNVDMLRVQVKTQSQPKNGRCTFNLHRGFYRSKGGMFRYANNDFDIAALVCLSIGQIFFCAAPVHSQSFKADWLRMPQTDRRTFDAALRILQHRRRVNALAWLASMEAEVAPIPPAIPAPQLSMKF
jgi:hypothetical protein